MFVSPVWRVVPCSLRRLGANVDQHQTPVRMALTYPRPPYVLQKSKKCPIVIKAGLSPVSGNATWSPKEGVATATYFVRAFVMHNSSATVQYQVALGSSKGYFQVRMPCTSLCSFFAQHMLPVQATSAAAVEGQAPS